jgi:predicted nucleic acid-binding protein
MMAANQLQAETPLYPMDALILVVADEIDATLVTFDGELVDNGAALPSDVV